jgi:hypothetical protein
MGFMFMTRHRIRTLVVRTVLFPFLSNYEYGYDRQMKSSERRLASGVESS